MEDLAPNARTMEREERLFGNFFVQVSDMAHMSNQTSLWAKRSTIKDALVRNSVKMLSGYGLGNLKTA